MQLAKERHITVVEERFTRDEMYVAEEVFVTGTAAEVTPVTEIDQRRIGTGRPGQITQTLQKAFFEVVGGTSSAHRQWLTPV